MEQRIYKNNLNCKNFPTPLLALLGLLKNFFFKKFYYSMPVWKKIEIWADGLWENFLYYIANENQTITVYSFSVVGRGGGRGGRSTKSVFKVLEDHYDRFFPCQIFIFIIFSTKLWSYLHSLISSKVYQI